MELKTLSMIKDKSRDLKPFEMKENTILKRRVNSVHGSVVMVKSQDYPGEFVGNYSAFLPSANMGEIWEKRVNKQKKPVEAKIKFLKQRDGSLKWEVLEMKDVESVEELSTDDEPLGEGY